MVLFALIHLNVRIILNKHYFPFNPVSSFFSANCFGLFEFLFFIFSTIHTIIITNSIPNVAPTVSKHTSVNSQLLPGTNS